MNEEDETDPNSLYDLKSRLQEFNAFDQIDVDNLLVITILTRSIKNSYMAFSTLL